MITVRNPMIGVNMNTKLSINEFRNYKDKLQSIAAAFKDDYELIHCNYKYNMTLEKVRKAAEYFKIEKELFSYDLSNIPFEEWQDLLIIAFLNAELDLSISRANIDFDFVSVYGHCNFKGCNLKNIDHVSDRVNPNYIDEYVFLAYKDLFLSDDFPEWFQEKWYYAKINIEDISKLNKNLIEILVKKFNVLKHIDEDSYFLQVIGIKHAIFLYNYSKEEYGDLKQLVYCLPSEALSKIDLNLEEPTAIINNVYQITVNEILYPSDKNCKMNLNLNAYPQKFVQFNEKIFKVHDNLSENIRKRYYNRELNVNDILSNYEIFKNLPLANFMLTCHDDIISLINYIYGDMAFQKIYPLYPKLIRRLSEEKYIYHFFRFYKRLDIETGLKELVINLIKETHSKVVPEWAAEMFSSIIDKYSRITDLKKWHSKVCLFNYLQRRIVESNNVDNAIKLDLETDIFSHENGKFQDILKNYLEEKRIIFPKSCTYQEFRTFMAGVLAEMRENDYFRKYSYDHGSPDYSFIASYSDTFYQDFRYIFIDKNADYELKKAFYLNCFRVNNISLLEKYFLALEKENLVNVIYSEDEKFRKCFVPFYTSHFGNAALLNLLKNYGYNDKYMTFFLDEFRYDDSMSRQQADKEMRNAIYKVILKYKDFDRRYLFQRKEFLQEYPDVFLCGKEIIDIAEPIRLEILEKFYSDKITYEDIFCYPVLKKVLRYKNIEVIIRSNSDYYLQNGMNESQFYLQKFGKDKFLNLCSAYGKFIENSSKKFKNLNNITYEGLCQIIENSIVEEVVYEGLTFEDGKTPEFLIRKHPELYIDKMAPQELKRTIEGGIDFYDLAGHFKEYMPYLKDKAAMCFFIRKDKKHKDALVEYFNLLGTYNALKLGACKPDAVSKIIYDDKVNLMYTWYLKTDRKFLPGAFVIEKFPEKDIDKFLAASSKWSNLMCVSTLNNNDENSEAILKLAYIFGTFHEDSRGFKLAYDLLTRLPNNLNENALLVLECLDFALDNNSNFETYFPNNIAKTLCSCIGFEKFPITPPNFFKQLYRRNKNGTNIILTIDQQKYPKTSRIIRQILADFREFLLLNGNNIHQLFGNLDFCYDSYFREFLCSNLVKILKDTDNFKYLTLIQKQFNDIKAINSNRHLTWEMAVNYVLENRFVNVHAGNEMMAYVAAVAGYTQTKFDKLQEIYEYSKKRLKSSIPFIEITTPEYTYGTLRLDDPLGLAIGTFTNCCQEIGQTAEVCMEHSMTSSDGRVFVIKDNENNIVAQSWVWRNQNVLCFDNIEIPHKAFERARYKGIELSKVIFSIYKKAGNLIIAKDKKRYQDLLESGDITKQEYDSLVLSKVTIGMGCNDIAEELKKAAIMDTSNITKPTLYYAPVKLSRKLYIKDSKIQYIIAGKQDDIQRKKLKTKVLYVDEFKIYDNANFKLRDYLYLKRLELLTRDSFFKSDYYFSKRTENINYIAFLAHKYGLNPNTARVIYNSNISIIYDTNNVILRIADIFYNRNNLYVAYCQISLAIEQIKDDKEIDLSLLDEETRKLCGSLNINNNTRSRYKSLY